MVKIFFCILLYLIPRPAGAWEIIDAPTTQTIDAYTYRLAFRFYSDGGLLTRATFGVFRNINIGFAWDVKNLIGTKDIELVPPSVHLKILIYEGSKNFPSFAIGYDGQGYFWNREKQIYDQKERGIYLVLNREIFMPDLEFTIGGNINDFKASTVYGFTGIVYTVEKISFMVEYDNIYEEHHDRLNAGLRYTVVPELSFEFFGRNITRSESAERIVKICYVSKF